MASVCCKSRLFSTLKVESTNPVDVMLPADETNPEITGCVFIPDGQVILCDARNNRIKILDHFFTVQKSLHIGSRPWDVSVIDKCSVVVTLPDIQQMQYIQVTPKLEAGRVITFDKRCWGVDVVCQNIYITCHNGSSPGEVRILDIDGNVERSIGLCLHYKHKFGLPFYVTVNAESGKIYVSDRNRYTITCLMRDGSVVYKYCDADLRWPRGMCVDYEDNIIVCGGQSGNVQIITADGKNLSTLLSSRDGIPYPACVAYHDNSDTLIIGYDRLDVIKVK